MKKIFLAIFAIFAVASCKQPSELPPINDGYAPTFILPDPVDLTSEDRAFIQRQRDEYDNAIKN